MTVGKKKTPLPSPLKYKGHKSCSTLVATIWFNIYKVSFSTEEFSSPINTTNVPLIRGIIAEKLYVPIWVFVLGTKVWNSHKRLSGYSRGPDISRACTRPELAALFLLRRTFDVHRNFSVVRRPVKHWICAFSISRDDTSKGIQLEVVNKESLQANTTVLVYTQQSTAGTTEPVRTDFIELIVLLYPAIQIQCIYRCRILLVI